MRLFFRFYDPKKSVVEKKDLGLMLTRVWNARALRE